MRRYRLSRLAVADIHAIWDYLAIECGSPDAAFRQIESVYQRLDLLAQSPLLGEVRHDLKEGLRTFRPNGM
jgi:plasmid stabilization system protein ParE